jgi:hypothetical protein
VVQLSAEQLRLSSTAEFGAARRRASRGPLGGEEEEEVEDDDDDGHLERRRARGGDDDACVHCGRRIANAGGLVLHERACAQQQRAGAGPSAPSSQQPARASRARPVPSTAREPAAREAMRAAAAEGLELPRSAGVTGFRGVYPAGAGRFYANAVTPGAARVNIGSYETAEEAALARAQYLSDHQARCQSHRTATGPCALRPDALLSQDLTLEPSQATRDPMKSKAKAQGFRLERSDIASGFKGVYPAGAGRFYANACRMKLGVFDTAEEVCTRPRNWPSIAPSACDIAHSFECRRRRLRLLRDFGMGITATPPPHAPLGPPARTAVTATTAAVAAASLTPRKRSAVRRRRSVQRRR